MRPGIENVSLVGVVYRFRQNSAAAAAAAMHAAAAAAIDAPRCCETPTPK